MLLSIYELKIELYLTMGKINYFNIVDFGLSNIRFSIQLRFSDLACNDYKNRYYPINHKILIKDF